VENDLTEKVVFLEGGEDVDADKEYQQLVEEASIEECALELPRGYLSVSQVNTYRRCPLQYYFRYIKDLIRAPSAALAEGRALHEGVAIGHVESVKTDRVPLDIMLDAYNDCWKQVKKDIDWKAEEDVVSEDLIVRRDHIFLSQYNDKFIPNLKPRIDAAGRPHVEQRFWVTVGEARVPVLGFIDLVAKNETKFTDKKSPDGSGEEEIIDHKVTTKVKTQDEVDNDFQLSVYSRVMGLTHVRFQCFVKTKTPQIKAVAARRNEQSWKWAEFIITQIAECISKGVFPPGADGWWCGPRWCGYYDMCRGRER
jgi:putative RecB family exonuclease